jgi:hypothetical protein
VEGGEFVHVTRMGNLIDDGLKDRLMVGRDLRVLFGRIGWFCGRLWDMEVTVESVWVEIHSKAPPTQKIQGNKNPMQKNL